MIPFLLSSPWESPWGALVIKPGLLIQTNLIYYIGRETQNRGRETFPWWSALQSLKPVSRQAHLQSQCSFSEQEAETGESQEAHG